MSKTRSIGRVAIAVVIIILIVVIGVGGYYYSKVTAPKPVPSYKVALLLPGPVNDLSWNEASYLAALQMAQYLNSTGKYAVHFSYATGLYTTPDILPVLQAYASKGYNFIIYAGYQGQVPVNDINASYPSTGFLVLDGYTPGGNVGVMVERGGQYGFVLGVLAALMSHTGKVAVIGGENVGDITWITQGFLLGVKWADENFNLSVQPIVLWVGNFDNPTASKALAVEAIEEGADVLFCSGDGITEGVAAAAAQYNVSFIWSEWNATSMAPQQSVGGVMMTWEPVMLQAFNYWITNHTMPMKPFYATFANGGLTLWVSPHVPQNVRAVVMNVYTACKEYKIQVYQELSNGSLVWSPVTPPYSQIS